MAKHHSNGGFARAKALGPARRAGIARAAAKARWAGQKTRPKPTYARRISFKVTMTVPEGATFKDAKAYILDAIHGWKGGLQPPCYGPGGFDPNEEGDPMHELNTDTVRVTRL